MERLRNIAFEAVIGVGGTGAHPEKQGISYKVHVPTCAHAGRYIQCFVTYRVYLATTSVG
jgi:hypothetical protein